MEERRKELWKEILILWEAITIHPDKIVNELIDENEGIHDFKNKILQKLGLEENKIKFGCPFCEEFLSHGDFGTCDECPISKEEDSNFACEDYTPYKEYHDEFSHRHDGQLASEFYKYLISLAKKDGYEPDFALMFWNDMNLILR